MELLINGTLFYLVGGFVGGALLAGLSLRRRAGAMPEGRDAEPPGSPS